MAKPSHVYVFSATVVPLNATHIRGRNFDKVGTEQLYTYTNIISVVRSSYADVVQKVNFQYIKKSINKKKERLLPCYVKGFNFLEYLTDRSLGILTFSVVISKVRFMKSKKT